MPVLRRDTGPVTTAPRSNARHRPERVYDSFVVRLWREVGSRRLLRVEIEHAQSGGVAGARGVTVAWIGTQIAALLGEARSPPARPASRADDPPG